VNTAIILPFRRCSRRTSSVARRLHRATPQQRTTMALPTKTLAPRRQGRRAPCHAKDRALARVGVTTTRRRRSALRRQDPTLTVVASSLLSATTRIARSGRLSQPARPYVAKRASGRAGSRSRKQASHGVAANGRGYSLGHMPLSMVDRWRVLDPPARRALIWFLAKQLAICAALYAVVALLDHSWWRPAITLAAIAAVTNLVRWGRSSLRRHSSLPPPHAVTS
jgi:hypothetical protein